MGKSIAKHLLLLLIGKNLPHKNWSAVEKIPLENSTGSFLRLSIQNMLTLVSVNLMLFLDRIILAQHATESLNASVTAGSIGNIFIYGGIAIVGIGDVFIGHCYGAGRHKKIGEILWQILWFCLMIASLFYGLSLFLPGLLFSKDSSEILAHTYLRWQLILGFLPVLVAALTSFFVGTKRFGFALFSVIAANLIRVIIEIPLVFGIDGLYEGLGAQGALFAAAISQVAHAMILGFVIMKKDNRRSFGSLNWRFKPTTFYDCIKLGTPQSVGSMLNYTAWGIVVNLLAQEGPKHLLIYTFIDSTYNLLCFTTEGLQKSVVSVSANLIGSGRSFQLSQVFRKALMLLLPILVVLSVLLFCYSDVLAKGIAVEELSKSEIYLACIVVWLYLGLDGMSWILGGLLTAMGDTLFVNPINGVSSFIGAGIAYVMTVNMHYVPSITCWISIIYGLINCSLLYLRYQSHHRYLKLTRSQRKRELVFPLPSELAIKNIANINPKRPYRDRVAL